jgi:oxygen-independent coproporphyrinogen-3 oxidase
VYEELTGEWPYPAVLTQSVKAYPVVQVMPVVGPQDASTWPRPMAKPVARWRDQIAGTTFNQIYVHVPFCPFLCHFCPLYKVQTPRERADESKARYVRWLLGEIDRWADVGPLRDIEFHSIYLGGGTPTELTPEQLAEILDALRRRFRVAPDAEITLEGVARQMLGDYLGATVEHGVNRISFGIQSLDLAVRRKIGRGDDVEDYEQIFSTVRSRWPQLSINTEIMAGLPEQTNESLAADLDQLVRWAPNSLDILYYVLMPGTKLQRLVSLGRRREPRHGDTLLAARAQINRRMRLAGYEQLTGEVFVRDDRDLFTRASFGGSPHRLNTVLALGPSGFGMIDGTAYQNVPDLAAYGRAIENGKLAIERAEQLTLTTARRRAQVFSLLELSVDPAVFDRAADHRLVERWRRLGLVDDATPRLSTRGALWYNHLQMEVLPLKDLVRTLGMFGSLAEQLRASKENLQQLPEHRRELVQVIRGRGLRGRLRFAAYRAYLRLAALMRRDQGALGFTGPVVE